MSVSSREHYFSLLQTYTPDDQLKLSVLRGLQELQKRVELTALPKGYVLSYALKAFGFNLQQGCRGLLVKTVVADSLADRVGIHRGDLLVKVDGVETNNLAEYEQLMEDRLGRQPLAFLIVRDNRGYLVELP